MKENRLKLLLDKHVKDQLSSKELDEMFALIDELGVERYEQLLDELLEHPEKRSSYMISSDQKSRLIRNVLNIVGGESSTRRREIVLPILKWASAIVLIGAISLYFLQDNADKSAQEYASALEHIPSDIWLTPDSLPRLTLDNGKSFVVDAQGQSLLQKNGLELQFDNENRVLIQPTGGADGVQNLCYSTPKGYTSKVLLADGTKIWLNSNTKIYYPTAFASGERRVRLEGEAFFEVSHDAVQPFYVELGSGNIKVLGTSFNVSNYVTTKKTTTTLLTGRVEFENANTKTVLLPNEQATVTSSGSSIQKKRVNVDEYTSWMKDYYLFNDKTVQEILATIQNWYDIDGVDVQVADHELYTGTLRRSKSLRSLLAHLEKISNLKIELQGRRVVVMK